MNARRVYAVLAALGFLVPNSVFWPWLLERGLDPQGFVQALFSNGVSSFFGLDVVFSALALAAFVVIEGARLGLRRRWIPIVATCVVGVSLGLPLFLYQRQVHLERATG